MIRYAFLFLVSFSAAAAAEELPVPPIPPVHAPAEDFAPVADWSFQSPNKPEVSSLGFGVVLHEARAYEVASAVRGQATESHKTVQPIAAGLNVSVSF